MPTLIVFTRWPEPGVTKTRLIDALGSEGAARLQHALTLRTLAAARDAATRVEGLKVEVRFEGGNAEHMASAFGDDLAYVPQGEGDLGARLARAIGDAFRGNQGPVAVIGADCPDLDGEFLAGAFEASGPGRAVIGPAADGGFTLLALATPAPELFEGIPWGSDSVLRGTRERAEAAGLAVILLPTLGDVDRPEDLPRVADLL